MAKKATQSRGKTQSRAKQARGKQRSTDPPTATELRIIGGKLRGRKLQYHGDQVTRPMKHRVREAIFNLVSTGCEGRHAIDLFAGTGALGLEAISRGGVGATLIERHIPTARIVQENIDALELTDRCTLCTTSAFLWGLRDLPHVALADEAPPSHFPLPPAGTPWVVFCSPPYAFFVERQEEMLTLIAALIDHAPSSSIFLIEADERFDFELLPGGVAHHRKDPGWDVRTYAPAVVGVWQKP